MDSGATLLLREHSQLDLFAKLPLGHIGLERLNQQQSYAETVADTYRHLANLLLQQNRVLEAQEVLDLLKLQELDDYLRNVRGNKQTAQGLDCGVFE